MVTEIVSFVLDGGRRGGGFAFDLYFHVRYSVTLTDAQTIALNQLKVNTTWEEIQKKFFLWSNHYGNPSRPRGFIFFSSIFPLMN